MQNSLRKLFSRNLVKLIINSVFFVLFYLYLWFVVDLRLIYHGAGAITDFPFFYRGWNFFREIVSHPGGLVEYISAFLAQFFYYSWAGAFIVALVVWLFCVCVNAFVKAINAPDFRWVRFVPAILLLIIYTRYTHHFVTVMALLTALVFVCLYLKIDIKNKLLHSFILLIFSVILYTIAGGAYLLFAALCAIYELFFKRRWQLGLLCLLFALIIPYIEGNLIFDVSITDIYSKLSPFSWEVVSYEVRRRMLTAVYILYLFLPLTAIGIWFWRRFLSGSALSLSLLGILGTACNETNKKVNNRSIQRKILRYLKNDKVKPLVLFVVAIAAVLFSYDTKTKALFEADYYSCYNMWPQVIKVARRHPDSIFVAHAFNRALYHTGRLGYDMFTGPQDPRHLLLVSDKKIFTSWKRFNAYLDLGYINLAEQDLNNSIGKYGEHPVILKRLALINMVKGEIGTALIYLGALSRTLFDADWAGDYLDRIKQDPTLLTDEQIQHLRSLMMKEDVALTSFRGADVLPKLLAANRHNKMAFEYLMAWCLLNKQFSTFMANLDRLDDFDYSQIPTLYEEMILIYMIRSRKTVDLRGRQISPGSYKQFDDFNRVLKRYSGNKQAAFAELHSKYRDTFLFYNLYKPLKAER